MEVGERRGPIAGASGETPHLRRVCSEFHYLGRCLTLMRRSKSYAVPVAKVLASNAAAAGQASRRWKQGKWRQKISDAWEYTRQVTCTHTDVVDPVSLPPHVQVQTSLQIGDRVYVRREGTLIWLRCLSPTVCPAPDS